MLRYCIGWAGSILLGAVAVCAWSTPTSAQTCGGDAVAVVANGRNCVSAGSGQSFRDCPACPDMVVVPAGQFTMGSPIGEVGRTAEEGPQRSVTIAKPFAIGKFEVTFAEWDACLAAGGCTHRPDDKGWGRGRRPVINVSWSQISGQYLPWLSRTSGQPYRLLSEAEWEYAARAGTAGAYSWERQVGSANGNCKGCDSKWGGSQTAPAGSFAANPFGIHDMNGNVFELVADCWNKDHQGVAKEGVARTDGTCSRRVIRGGSWFTPMTWLRSAARSSDPTDYSNANVGFRVARTIVEGEAVADSGRLGAAIKPPDQVLRAHTQRFVDLAMESSVPAGGCTHRLAPLRNSVRWLKIQLWR
jgi:formylglycine-generating enzyme required for sulfatase activity